MPKKILTKQQMIRKVKKEFAYTKLQNLIEWLYDEHPKVLKQYGIRELEYGFDKIDNDIAYSEEYD